MHVFSSCSHGEFRLVNITADNFRGTPEVCVAGRWNEVCTNGDSVNQTAAVMCQQYGCLIGHAQQGSTCSENTLNVDCSGSETILTHCDIRDSSVCVEESSLCIEVNCSSCQSEIGNLKIYFHDYVHGYHFLLVSDLLPYGNASGDLRVPTALDNSSGPVQLKQNFTFFGTGESIIFVSGFQISVISYSFITN